MLADWLSRGVWRGGLQGYLTYKKTHPPRTLPEAYAQGPTVFLGGGAVSYERGTPETCGGLMGVMNAAVQGLLEIKDTRRPRTLQ